MKAVTSLGIMLLEKLKSHAEKQVFGEPKKTPEPPKE